MERPGEIVITVGSLFSGIGGKELGLERTGHFKTLWFCENEPYASAVLKKHYPDIPNHGDITKVDWNGVEKPEMLTGGFPCQDISVAGHGKGIRKGERSGLWKEYAKAIRILLPRYALIENVPAIAHRGLDVVLADLASLGYDAEWGLLSASAVGTLHRRERLFVFAYCNAGCSKFKDKEICTGRNPIDSISAADNSDDRIQRLWQKQIPRFKTFSWCEDVRSIEDLQERSDIPQPLIRRSSDGVSARLYRHRIRCIGNAVVPQVAETIGYWIVKWVNEKYKNER